MHRQRDGVNGTETGEDETGGDQCDRHLDAAGVGAGMGNHHDSDRGTDLFQP